MKNLSLKYLLKILLALVSLALMLSFAATVRAGEVNKSATVNALFVSNSQDQFLTPDEAFKLNLTRLDAENIQANFTIAPGHYLYRERVKFSVEHTAELKASDAQIVAVTLPRGEIKQDANFGKQEVYHHDFKANIKISPGVSTIAIAASYQGCSEKGLCYAPIKKTISVALSKAKPSANITTSNSNNATDDDTTVLLKTGNIWLIIFGFFGAGLLLSLTPCVLPMIPILSSIIVGSQSQGVHQTKLYSFALSVSYVLGMALSYTLAGVAAGLSGNLLSQSLQNVWVLGASALVFVLLAFSMFGFYELQLPSALETKLIKTSNSFKGGKFLGVFIMGALSALIVSPCVAAPLAGALIYISQSQNVLLGGVALFALSLGMGVPLLLIGASAGKLLPKTGNWMNAVRHFFGVLMLAMAVWLISPVIPTGVQLALWATLLIVTAVFLNALDNLPAHANGFAKFWKGIAVILLIVGVTLLIGALSGAKSALQPFNGITSSLAANNNSANQSQNVSSSLSSPGGSGLNESSLAFTRIKNISELDKKLAETNGKPVMLDFYADWCVACKELEQLTFSDTKIQQLLANTTLLQVDVTANTDEDKALLKRFVLFGPPGVIFFDGHGKLISSVKTIGFQNVERFTATLAKRDYCVAALANHEASAQKC